MNDNDEEEPSDDEKGNDRGLEVIKEEEKNEIAVLMTMVVG